MHIGIDIIEIDRIEGVLNKYPKRFLEKIFTDFEQKYCRGRASRLAARFASKEAVMKALGTGVRGVGWKEIEVQRHRSGKPFILLHGRAQKRAKKLMSSDPIEKKEVKTHDIKKTITLEDLTNPDKS